MNQNQRNLWLTLAGLLTAAAAAIYLYVAQETPPTATISVTPETITEGQEATVAWETSDADTVTLNGSPVALDGTQQVSPAIGETTYTLIAIGQGGEVTAADTLTVEQLPQPPPSVLLAASDLTYLGAFKLPPGKFGASEFAYGATVLASSSSDRLFVASGTAIAEVKCPAPVKAPLASLPTASVVQPFVAMIPRLPSYPLEGSVFIGGLLKIDDQLVGTIYEYYDGDGDAAFSHFRIQGLDLAASPVTGMYSLDFEAGSVAGWMCKVPEKWQSLGPYLCGQGCIPIITRTSWGAAAVAFDPALLGNSPAPATALIHYSQTHPMAPITGPANELFSGATDIHGMLFKDDSVLFFGVQGLGVSAYGEGTADPALAGQATPGGSAYVYDPVRKAKGYHAYPYRYQVWGYKAHDLAAVQAGTKQPWELRPYATWKLEGLYETVVTEENMTVPGPYAMGGVAWDSDTGTLSIAERAGRFGGMVVHQWKVN